MALHAQHVQRHGAEASSRRRRHFHQRGQLCGFETGAATDMFDLIGVVERWDELCALLNQILPVPGFELAVASARIDGTNGSAAWKAQRPCT